jgi:hypothetical protein
MSMDSIIGKALLNNGYPLPNNAPRPLPPKRKLTCLEETVSCIAFASISFAIALAPVIYNTYK